MAPKVKRYQDQRSQSEGQLQEACSKLIPVQGEPRQPSEQQRGAKEQESRIFDERKRQAIHAQEALRLVIGMHEHG